MACECAHPIFFFNHILSEDDNALYLPCHLLLVWSHGAAWLSGVRRGSVRVQRGSVGCGVAQ